jgi:preprotein translocase SecF subunit
MIQLLVGTDFAFMKHRRIAYVLSIAIVLATAAWLVMNRGPRYSVDFTGGTMLQIRTSQVLPADQLRSALTQAGLPDLELQQMAGENRDEYILRVKTEGGGEAVFESVQAAIGARFSGVTAELRRTEQVGPKVGRELREKAIWAILGSLGGILLYVGVRYEFKFALGAVVALFHDVFVTLGFLCFTNREISLTVIAALLTIAGFSINDKVVVFDRIRERSKALRKESHSRAMDIAVNETLSRTIITNTTVLLSAIALFVWGGDVLRDFSFGTLVGILLGTYSSVYLASALALDIWIWLDRRKGIQAE